MPKRFNQLAHLAMFLLGTIVGAIWALPSN
jgi:hypothetical protein